MRAVACVSVAFTCVTFLTAAEAGAVLESGKRDLPNGKEKEMSTIHVDHGMVRVDTLKTGERAPENGMIFKNDTMIFIDHNKKTYSVVDKAALQQWAGKANAAMKKMEEQLASMPPEQRAMVEKMMGKQPGGKKAKHVPQEFTRTARTEKAGGYSCQVWEGKRAGVKVSEVCATTSTVAGSDDLIRVMKSMKAMTDELMESLDSFSLQSSANEEWEALGKIEGFPVMTRTFANGKAESETALKSAKNGAVPASEFEPPAGYTRKDLNIDAG